MDIMVPNIKVVKSKKTLMKH